MIHIIFFRFDRVILRSLVLVTNQIETSIDIILNFFFSFLAGYLSTTDQQGLNENPGY
jgi:hypothetical protein